MSEIENQNEENTGTEGEENILPIPT